jgi:hypothetical protein
MSDMIWNGSYTLGDSQETQITAGTGIKVTTPAAGQIQIADDETVLWENTSAYPSVASVTLSENWNNFKYLRFDTAEAYGNSNISNQFDTASYSLAGSRAKTFTIGHYAPDPANNILYIRYIRITFANNDYLSGTVTSGRVSLPAGGSIGFTDSDNNTRIVRVVGINRISGGN